MTAIDVVIMAAGKGTRMKSRLPKVLHRLAGRAPKPASSPIQADHATPYT